MKKALALGLAISMLAAPAIAGETKKKRPSARDLFLTNGDGNSTGMKVHIKLLRGGKEEIVPPTHTFKSGDKIRLQLATNFDGFVTVSNLGSSGARKQLFPAPGKSPAVKSAGGFEVPPSGWFEFDAATGTEKVVVKLLKASAAQASGGANTSAPAPAGTSTGGAPSAGSTGGPATAQEDEEILAMLNSRSVHRDLSWVVEGNDGYALMGASVVSSPTSITLSLKHE